MAWLLAPTPLISPAAFAVTVTDRFPPVAFVTCRPCPALPVIVAEAFTLIVPPPVLFTRMPALFEPEPVTEPRTLIVLVVVVLVSLT